MPPFHHLVLLTDSPPFRESINGFVSKMRANSALMKKDPCQAELGSLTASNLRRLVLRGGNLDLPEDQVRFCIDPVHTESS